jgi:hypothetical protein
MIFIENKGDEKLVKNLIVIYFFVFTIFVFLFFIWNIIMMNEHYFFS